MYFEHHAIYSTFERTDCTQRSLYKFDSMEKAQLLFTIFFCAVLIMFLNYLVCTIFSCIYNIESMAKTQLRITIFLCAMLFLFLNYLVITNWSSLFSRVDPSGIKGMKEVTSGKPNAQDIQLTRQKVRYIGRLLWSAVSHFKTPL